MDTLHHTPLSERSGTERMILEDIANVLDDLVYAENVMIESSGSEDTALAKAIMESAPHRLSTLNSKWIEWQGIKRSFHDSLGQSRDEYQDEVQ